MACNVLIHRLKTIRKSASKKNYAVKTNACGCKTHCILIVNITRPSCYIPGTDLQFELCKVHAAKLEREGIDFFNNPEVTNQTDNPQALKDYFSGPYRHQYRHCYIFRNWYRISSINFYEVTPVENTTILSKRIQRRNAVKDRIKRMMDQSNTKLLKDQDWYDAMELALKERMIEQIMKS